MKTATVVPVMSGVSALLDGHQRQRPDAADSEREFDDVDVHDEHREHVGEEQRDEGDWLADDAPAELALDDEGVLVLGIVRNGSYIGAPGPDTQMRPGDTVILYGKEDRLRKLSDRETNDRQAHENAVEEHEADLEKQEMLIEF